MGATMARTTTIRKRDATATRAAILTAARDRFLRDSYDSVGLRDIANGAGVDVALIARSGVPVSLRFGNPAAAPAATAALKIISLMCRSDEQTCSLQSPTSTS